MYDVRVDTKDNSLVLNYLVSVKNCSGDDWMNTQV